MSVTYLPRDLLRRMAPRKLVERLVTPNLTLNRAVLSMLAKSDIMGAKTLERIALKVIKDYKEKYKDERSDGASKTEALEETLNGKRLMVQRVQNAIVYEVAKDVKSQYRGEYYIWLPSDAENPDPLHQLNYGKRFQVGKGEMPGDRYGCQCGMEILVDEDELEL